MPSTQGAANVFQNAGILYAPSKAANAGGVAGSYLEWIQNLSSDYWEHERVLDKLKSIMISARKKITLLEKRLIKLR